MRNLLLHFGSNSAVEILEYILESSNEFNNNNIYIHDDDKSYINKKELLDICSKINFIEKFNELKKIKNSISLITIGDTNLRDKKYENLKKNNFRMHTFIHPRCRISPSAKIGKGCIIGPFAVIGTKSILRSNSIINSYSLCGHHTIIGKSCILSPRTSVLGEAKLGNRIIMGTGSVVMPKIKINSDSKITSNSVVYREVKFKSLLHGNPAKKFKI